MQLDGIIEMNGAGCYFTLSGAGAGGTVAIQINQNFAGSGLISANGGNATGGGGGGGRVAVNLRGSPSEFRGRMTAYGGTGEYYGGAGTVWLNAPINT
jgi:hypothetical protein